MKKRIFSFLLALWMILSLVPMSALAACDTCDADPCTCAPSEPETPTPTPAQTPTPPSTPTPTPPSTPTPPETPAPTPPSTPTPPETPAPTPPSTPTPPETPTPTPPSTPSTTSVTPDAPSDNPPAAPSCQCGGFTQCQSGCAYCQQSLGTCLATPAPPAAPPTASSCTCSGSRCTEDARNCSACETDLNNCTVSASTPPAPPSCTCQGTTSCAEGSVQTGCEACAAAAGNCRIVAVPASDPVAQAALVITDCPTSPYYGQTATVTVSGGSGNGEITVSATNATVTGGTNGAYTVTFDALGAGTLTFTKAADTNYNAASAEVSFTVSKTPVTPSLTGTLKKTYDGTANVGSEVSLQLTCPYGTPAVSATADLRYDSPAAGARTITASNITLNNANFELTAASATAQATIEKLTVDPTITFQSASPYTYTGSNITPEITVTCDMDGTPTTLKSGTDYTIAYSNNKAVGTGKVTITSKMPNHAFTKEATFAIERKAITPTVTPAGLRYTYTGEAITPSVTVSYGETILPKEEYTVTYSNNVNVGTASITVTSSATSNYTLNAHAPVEFRILPASLSISGATLAAKTYDGSCDAAVTAVSFTKPAKGAELTLGQDFLATARYSQADAGTGRQATITVTMQQTENAKNYTLTGNTLLLTGQTIAKAPEATISKTLYVHHDDTTAHTFSLAGLLAADPDLKGTPTYGNATIVTTGFNLSASAANGVLHYQLTGSATAGQSTQIQVEATGLTNYEKCVIHITLMATDKQIQNPLSITSPGAKTYGDSAFKLATTGGAEGNTVTFTATGDVVSISGNEVTIHKSGTAYITATSTARGYEDTTATLVLTVAKRALTVKAKDLSIRVDGALPTTFDYIATGLINGDTFITEPTITHTAYDPSVWGDYDINIQGGTLSNDSYDITYVKGLLSITPMKYKIIKGGHQLVIPGRAATFKSNANLDKFVCVVVDGKVLPGSCFSYTSGSTVVTLTKAYTKTLKAGTHHLTIVSTDGEASTAFYIKAYDSAPQTGDSTNNGLWIGLAVVAMVGFAGSLIGKAYLLKRKKS